MTISESSFTPISLNLERKRRTYTLQEFLRKEAKSLHKHEFINGQINKMPYAKGPLSIFFQINNFSNYLVVNVETTFRSFMSRV